MTRKKKVLIVLLVIFVLIQFFHPERNSGNRETENTIFVTPEVGNILQTSCYDCHSNYSNYPWYANVQPVAWWLDHHIDEAKEELNFSEFESYSLKRKLHKLEEIKKEIDEGEMPLSSYTLIHNDAKLSPEQKAILLNWVDITHRYLSDTLSRPKK